MYKLDENGNQILDADGKPILLDPTPPTPPAGDDDKPLKNQIEDLKKKLEAAQKDLEIQKGENERLDAFKDKVLSEKREEVDKRKSLEAVLEGHTPEEVKKALRLSKESEGDREEEIKTIVNSRVKQIKEDIVEPVQKENQQLRQEKESIRKKLASAIVVKEIVDNAKSYGALDDALVYFEAEFKNRIGVNEAGDRVYYTADGHETDNLNWEIEMIKLREKSPFLFDKNKGSTVNGNGNPSDGDVVNPWAKETLSYERQIKIMNDNPDMAKRLKEQAAKAA